MTLVELLPCPFCGGLGDIEHGPASQASGSLCSYRGWCDHCAFGLDWHTYEPDAITAWNTRAAHRRAAAGRKDRELLLAILAAQKVQPYKGWSITELNKAVDAAREHLGFPSIRDLNPSIAAMQDAARANAPALQALIATPQPDPRDAQIAELREALAPFARIAGPIKGEEGRITYLEAIEGREPTGEMFVGSFYGTGATESLWANDFRRARTALANSEGK